MRILFVNEIEGAAVSSVSGSLNYPADAIYHPFLRKKFKSLLDNDALTIDLDAAVPMNSFFMAFHNVESGTVSFFDGTLTPVGTPLDMTAAAAFFVAYFSTISAKRIVVDVACGAAQLYIGGIGAGTYRQMPDNVRDGYPFDVEDATSIARSPSGQTSRNAASPLRTRDFTWPNLDKSTADALDSNLLGLGIGKPVYVDLFEGSPEFDPPMYAAVSVPRVREHVGANRYNINVKFMESQ
jgi:hypothetical protein